MYECPDCGYFISAKELTDRQAGEVEDGISRRKLVQPKRAAAPPQTRHSLLPFAPKPVERSLSGEKVTFLMVFFGVMIATSFIARARYLNVAEMAGALPSMIFGAIMLTLAAGFALYYDNDCLRQCCLWWIGLAVVLAFFAVVLAVPTEQFGLAWPLIPQLAVDAWLFTILWRDRRSD